MNNIKKLINWITNGKLAIYDGLDSNESRMALSARQGKILNDKVNNAGGGEIEMKVKNYVYEFEIYANQDCTERLNFPFTFDKTNTIYIKCNVDLEIPYASNSLSYKSVSNKYNMGVHNNSAPGGINLNNWFANNRTQYYHYGNVIEFNISSNSFNLTNSEQKIVFNSLEDCQFGKSIGFKSETKKVSLTEAIAYIQKDISNNDLYISDINDKLLTIDTSKHIKYTGMIPWERYGQNKVNPVITNINELNPSLIKILITFVYDNLNWYSILSYIGESGGNYRYKDNDNHYVIINKSNTAHVSGYVDDGDSASNYTILAINYEG